MSEHSGRSQGPSYSFLPDLRGQPSYFKNSLKKILLHQIPALGPVSRGHSQFASVKKANQPHATQAPKLKAVLTHNSSGEGSGHRRRCCPFRVRFADETLRDTALRYWERSCAVRQGITGNRPAGRSAASERVFGSVGRWLESLPKALSTLEPKDHLSEDTCTNSHLPFIPRATAQRQRGDLKTFLEQMEESPFSWTQKLLVLLLALGVLPAQLGLAHGPETRPPEGVPAPPAFGIVPHSEVNGRCAKAQAWPWAGVRRGLP